MEITDKINYVLGKTVVYMLLIIYPFVMHNKLNDVTLTRFFFFIIVSYVGFLVLCINSLASFILKRVSDKKKYDDDNVDFINIQEGAYSAESQSISKVYDIKDKIKNMDLWKKLIFLFLFVCIMSYLFSPYKSVAFLGHGGRYTGLVFYGACVCMYYVVSTCYRFEKRDITYVLCSTILVNVWAVLNYAGMDPFYIYKDVPAAMKTVYISSLGNIDIYGMYVNMMLALAMFSFVYEESTAGKLFYGICALLGMMGSLASDSDMAVAGMFFAFVILIYFAISDYNRLIRYFMLAVELFIAGRILGVIYIFNQFNTRIIKSVGSIIVYKNVFVVFPVVCFIAIFIIQLLHDKCDLFANKKLIDKIKKIYGESEITDNENDFEEKMKDIDNIKDADINLNNDRTRNLKSIVDELKTMEAKTPTQEEIIQKYEDEQEDTAIISVEELLKHNNTFTYAKTEPKKIEPKEEVKEQKIEEEYLFEDVSSNAKVNIPTPTIKEEKKYTQSREIFSSVFSDNTRPDVKKEESNEMFLNSLKEFRNNL